ncbi:MAG: hypothetical protein O7E54_03315 [Planctomycetota bacterium]|nr:hypothetical protein [Planctomycetota bacterium]
MKFVLILAALALGFVAGLLVGGMPEKSVRIAPIRGGSTDDPNGGPPDGGGTSGRVASTAVVPIPDIPRIVRRDRRSARTQKEMAAFVYTCKARGKEAVGALRAFLKRGENVEITLWRFDGTELRGYPSLRAAYLEALRRIPGTEATNALQEVFDSTGSLEESYYCALALKERGGGDWVEDLLERVDTAKPTGPQLHILPAMVELAAVEDPVATAHKIEQRAPRGADGSDPRVLAAGLAKMPLEAALATSDRLLADPTITVRAKSRYLSTLLRKRLEVEAIASVRRAVERGGLEPDLVTRAVDDTVSSVGFIEDSRLFQLAIVENDSVAAGKAKGRFLRRLEEARRLVAAAYGPGSSDPRAQQALKRLAAAQRNFEKLE